MTVGKVGKVIVETRSTTYHSAQQEQFEAQKIECYECREPIPYNQRLYIKLDRRDGAVKRTYKTRMCLKCGEDLWALLTGGATAMDGDADWDD